MKDKILNANVYFQVAAFYSFYPLQEETISSLPDELIKLADVNGIRGSVLVASEGINGTICGSVEGVQAMLNVLMNVVDSNNFEVKFSLSEKQAFRKFKSRIKNEIVTMGVADINPLEISGQYIEPQDWNDYLDDPNTIVIDTRNEYEISIGTFSGSINPHTDIFRDFPAWVDQYLKPIVDDNPKKIAMFCTGGIRCEKATSYLKKEGFSNVHHLHGGILRYLEEIPESESRWEGECFVFDQRVALNHQLSPGVHQLCYACGMPLSPLDRSKVEYIPGIQCHYCISLFSDFDRERFAERQKHIHNLAKRYPGNTVWPSA